MPVLTTLDGRILVLGGNYITPLATPSGLLSLTAIDYQVTQGSSITTAMHVIQRAPGRIDRDIPVVFGFTGAAPVSLQGRVRRRSGGIVRDWTAVTGLVCSSVTNTGSGVLPGVLQGSDYILDLRDGVTQPTSGPLFSSTSARWGVGVNILFDGQSNMQHTLQGGYSTYTVPGTGQSEQGVYASGAYAAGLFDNAGWHNPSNGNGQFGPDGGSTTSGGSANDNVWAIMRFVATGLKAKYGYDVPVGLCPRAISGQSIESFTQPSGSHYLENVGSGTAAANTAGFSSAAPTYCGDFEGVVWHQGEANTGDSQAAYQAKLAALYQTYLGMVAPFGRTAATLWFLPAVIGNIDVAVGSQLELVRSAQQSFEAYAATQSWPLVRVGWTTIDLPRIDQFHMTDAASQISARRAVQSVLFMLGCATFSGRGPRLGSISRTGLVATVQVIHEGGTALQKPGAGAVTGFLANTAADFSGTAVTITAAIASAATLSWTFPGGTTFPVYVKYLGGQVGTAASCNPDVSNGLYDNTAYPSVATGSDVPALGLPLLPSLGAMVVA